MLKLSFPAIGLDQLKNSFQNTVVRKLPLEAAAPILSQANAIDNLERLIAMKEQGHITEDEYLSLKQKIMSDPSE